MVNTSQTLPALRKIDFINEKPVRLLAIMVLGVLIPNITGIVTYAKYSLPEIFGIYVFFISVSFIIWQGNITLMRLAKKKYKWGHKGYYKTLLAYFTVTSCYSGVASALLLLLWAFLSRENYTSWRPLGNTVAVVMVAASFIASVYENFFLNQEQVNALSRVEQLSLAKAQAELIALKNQIDPHFIFNSLNTLSYLIASDPPKAKLYNDTLAKVYHYLLRNKDKDLVLLHEELEFISNYFYLLKIRFADSINMVIEINDVDAEEFLILPISLQTLVENAIKHNEFTQAVPLVIYVSVNSHYVLVKNKINLKLYPVPTSHTGLANLDSRYKLITGRTILTDGSANHFTVKLPVINLTV